MVKISAGSYDLNKWLYGGYESDVITTLYGAPGCGKTNFCITAAVSLAKKDKKVLFIDTEGGFSSERVKQIIGLEDKNKFEYVLKNIFILKPTNFSEQKECFSQLLKYVNENISMIIVDGMTMLYRLEFADARGKELGDIQQVNGDLTKQMRALAEISRKNNIPVLVTNQVYSWDNQNRMVGGDILKYWSKCLIELINERGKRYARLVKHRSLPESNLFFQIYDRGIRKKGWL